MDLELYVADYHADYFLREFSYSASRFRGTDGQERELCDGAIWIGDVLILIQMKERNPNHDSGDSAAESKWFTKRVSKTAVDQLNSSVKYLEAESQLPLANLRSQVIDISDANPAVIHKLVVYRSSDALPLSDIYNKGRQSSRLGFVHFIHVDDYVNVCVTLHTPMEISDYLSYRADAALNNPRANELPEKALVGKYLTDTGIDGLEHADELYVDHLVDDRAEFSIGNLLRNYLDRVVSGNEGTQYHVILTELAKLTRNMLKLFRQRLLWAMDECKSTEPPIPSRFFCPETDCSFIFIPLAESERSKSLKAAFNFTTLSQYAFGSTRAIGLAVSPHTSPGAYQIQWCFLDHEWEYNADLQTFFADGSPFRETKPATIGKYEFDIP
jgi:hypothetical protein